MLRKLALLALAVGMVGCGDEAEEKPDKHSECGAGWTLDDAQALLLAEGDELRLRAVKRAVDAILEVTRQDQMADEFRQLAE